MCTKRCLWYWKINNAVGIFHQLTIHLQNVSMTRPTYSEGIDWTETSVTLPYPHPVAAVVRGTPRTRPCAAADRQCCGRAMPGASRRRAASMASRRCRMLAHGMAPSGCNGIRWQNSLLVDLNNNYQWPPYKRLHAMPDCENIVWIWFNKTKRLPLKATNSTSRHSLLTNGARIPELQGNKSHISHTSNRHKWTMLHDNYYLIYIVLLTCSYL